MTDYALHCATGIFFAEGVPIGEETPPSDPPPPLVDEVSEEGSNG
jgi:hypothetical protein